MDFEPIIEVPTMTRLKNYPVLNFMTARLSAVVVNGNNLKGSIMIEPTQTLECISKKIEELGVDGIIADEVVDGLMAAMEDLLQIYPEDCTEDRPARLNAFSDAVSAISEGYPFGEGEQ